MNEELAIKLLHPEKSDETIYILKEYDCLTDNIIEDAIRKARLLACEALERQIPKKVVSDTIITWGVSTKEPICPVCDYFLTRTYFIGGGEKKVSYCGNCGQSVDWSDWREEE